MKINSSNLAIKIISLFIAIFLWYYVYHILNRSTQEFTLGIKFDNIPSKLYTNFKLKNQKTRLIVKGKKENVKEFLSNASNLKCLVDLTNAKIGSNKYKIQMGKNLEMKALLNKVDVYVKKNFITINFENISRKKVEVIGNVIGTFNEDFKVVDVSYKPSHIIIEGPFSKINTIDNVETENYMIKKKDAKEYKTKIKDKVKLNPLPSYIKNITKIKEIDINVTMYIGLKEHTVTDIKIISMGNLFSGLVVKEKKPSLDYVIYKGPSDIVNKFKSNNIKAYINIAPFSKPGKYTVNVIPQKEKGVSIVDYSPKKITVTLIKK